jgi:hypothetical protein
MCYGYTKSKRLYNRVMDSNKVKKLLKEQSGQEEHVPNKSAKSKKTKAQK